MSGERGWPNGPLFRRFSLLRSPDARLVGESSSSSVPTRWRSMVGSSVFGVQFGWLAAFAISAMVVLHPTVSSAVFGTGAAETPVPSADQADHFVMPSGSSADSSSETKIDWTGGGRTFGETSSQTTAATDSVSVGSVAMRSELDTRGMAGRTAQRADLGPSSVRTRTRIEPVVLGAAMEVAIGLP
jgi:hypothetical protein